MSIMDIGILTGFKPEHNSLYKVTYLSLCKKMLSSSVLAQREGKSLLVLFLNFCFCGFHLYILVLYSKLLISRYNIY